MIQRVFYGKKHSPSLADKERYSVLKLFKPKSCSWLGVDISSTSVNLVELTHATGQFCLQAYACKALPAQAVEAGVIKDIDAVANSIIHLLKTHCFLSKQAIVAVPDSISMSKIIQLSADLHAHEVEEWVMMDAEKHIPYSLNEICLDYHVMGPSTHYLDKLDILLVATRTQNIQQRVEVIARAGLDAHVIEVESHAVARAVAGALSLHHQKITAVVDVREQSICCFVFKEMKLIFSREEAFDNNDRIQVIYERLPLQIKRMLQFCLSTTNEASVDYFILSGKLTESQGLASSFQSYFNKPIQRTNPFTNMRVSDYVNQTLFYEDCSSLLVACGLALRGEQGLRK